MQHAFTNVTISVTLYEMCILYTTAYGTSRCSEDTVTIQR